MGGGCDASEMSVRYLTYRPRTEAPEFESVLWDGGDPPFDLSLRLYLKRKHAPEQLDFLLAVRGLYTCAPEDAEARARAIRNRFVVEDAPMRINVACTDYKACLEKLETARLREELPRPHQEFIDAFTECFMETFCLLKSGDFTDWLRRTERALEN